MCLNTELYYGCRDFHRSNSWSLRINIRMVHITDSVKLHFRSLCWLTSILHIRFYLAIICIAVVCSAPIAQLDRAMVSGTMSRGSIPLRRILKKEVHRFVCLFLFYSIFLLKNNSHKNSSND